MSSSVQYYETEEDVEQDRKWLAEELERCKRESAEANDSDTLSCSDFGCIDDITEDEVFMQVVNGDNGNEYTETGCSKIVMGNCMVDHDYIRKHNEDEADDVYMNFSYDQQGYCNIGHSTKLVEKHFENLDFIDDVQDLYVMNGEIREGSGQVDAQSCFGEKQSGVRSVSSRRECMDLGIIEKHEHDDEKETSGCGHELNDDVKTIYESQVDDCLDQGSVEVNNQISFINVSDIDEEHTKYDHPSDHNEYCTENIKVIVINTVLKNYEEVRLQETKQSELVQVSLFSEEPTDLCNPKQNDTKEENINHQTTQTCDILFRDKDKSSAEMFICEYCQKVFATQYKLDSHHYRVHGSQKDCKESCVTRPKSTPKVSTDWPPNIQQLVQRINGKKYFFCNLCSYCVDRCDSITKHMLRVHSEGRPLEQFQCEVCGKMFVDRAYLRNHKVSHTTEKLYSCDVCGKAFHRQPSLKRHLQTHTAHRQFSCTLCDYQSDRKHVMYKHVENHKQGRAYICHICHTHLFTQLAYRSHMYEHRALANSCSICKVGFSSKERMMSHMKRAHSAYEISVYKNEPKQDQVE